MSVKATIRDVARHAGVSLGTTSNYLNGTKPVSEKSGRAIDAAVKALGFIPNGAARVVRGARSHAIGFIIPDASNPFFMEIARGIDDVALHAGLVVVTCNTQGEAAREKHFARSLSEMRVTGAIVTATTATESHLQLLASSGAALVVLGTSGAESTLPTISVDDHLGGHLAMQHLLNLGHRDIVLVGGPAGELQVAQRFAGATRAWDHTTKATGPKLRRVDAAGSTLEARMAAADEIANLHPMPTAALCANDVIALAVAARLTQLGLSIPADFSVIGYDDIDAARAALPPLTTIRQPQYEIGRAAANTLLAAARGDAPPHISPQFAPAVVVRQSTATPRLAAS